MRQQYRFRGIGDDTHVWDVHRLARESQGLPVVEVALAEIAELHEADWFPDEHPATLQIVEHLRLIQAADPRDRILLCTDGRMVDGTHRLAKAASLGYPHIAAVRFPRPPGRTSSTSMRTTCLTMPERRPRRRSQALRRRPSRSR